MNWKKTGWYGLLGITSLAYLAAGVPKLLALPVMLENLARLGYGRAFTIFLGVCWTSAAIGVWSRCHRKAAVLGTLFITSGAFASHWVAGDGIAYPLFAFVILGVTILYADGFFEYIFSEE